MKLLSIILLSLIISIAQAKCMKKDDKKMIEKSSLIFIGTITEANHNLDVKKLDNLCMKTKKGTIDLKYTVMLKESIKGHTFTNGPFQLEYPYACQRFPRSTSFLKDRDYIFAVKKLENNGLTLVGYACGYWGWEKNEAKKVALAVKRLGY